MSGRLRAWALAAPRVLVVDPPGHDAARWETEAEVDRRGWALASNPAETDLLVVCGPPGRQLAAAVDVLWSQVPAPRARLQIAGSGSVASALDAAVDALHRAAAARDDDRPAPTALLQTTGPTEVMDEGLDHAGMDHAGMDHAGLDRAGMDHAGMDQAGMDHSAHGGMDHSAHGGMDHGAHGGMDHGAHGGMDVMGLGMADTAPDRDGLALDSLTFSLGPVLPGWPTGLVLRAALHGDVLTDVRPSWLDEPDPIPPQRAEPRLPAVQAVDALARFLLVVGWPAQARLARRARDGMRSEDPATEAAAREQALVLARRIRQSRLLAWNLRGMAPVEETGGRGAGSTDVLARVRAWCGVVTGELPSAAVPDLPLDRLAAALEGVEVGAARVLVASLPMAAGARASHSAEVVGA